MSAWQTQEAAWPQQEPDTQGLRRAADRRLVSDGVAAVEMDNIIIGWSTKKEILGTRVMSEAKERIGEIEDIIITPQKAASYAIIGVSGFIGIGELRVAISFQQLKMQETNFVLAGATKDAVKALPEFKYASK